MAKKKLVVGLIALLVLWWMLSTPVQEGFHERGTGGGRLFGCGCNALAPVAGYRQSAAHPLFIDGEGCYDCKSCLGSDGPEGWCYDPPHLYADPPPLDYRVPKDVCYC